MTSRSTRSTKAQISVEKVLIAPSLSERVCAALDAEELLPTDEETQVIAVGELTNAIEGYLHQLDASVAEQRSELNALAKALGNASAQLDALSPQSLQLYCNAADAPKGKASLALSEALHAAQNAATNAAKLPNKSSDFPKTVLAYAVARVLRDHIHIKPTLTRDNNHTRVGERGGGAFVRLLRKVLFVAGEEPANDLHPIMKQALELLDNPRGDFVI